MIKEEMLKKQNAIYVMTIDRLWEHLSPEQREEKEWIFEEMENELNKIQNENLVDNMEEIHKLKVKGDV